MGVRISSALKWGHNITLVLKKAHQRLFSLRQLKKKKKRSCVSSDILELFCRAAVESVLVFGITVWFGNMSGEGRETIEEKITLCGLPPPAAEVNNTRPLKEKKSGGAEGLEGMLPLSSQPFNLLPPHTRLESIQTGRNQISEEHIF